MRACPFIQSCLTFATPWTVAHPAILSMGFPRQEYWSWLPFPSPGDLPNPGIKPVPLVSPALADGFFATQPPEKAPFSLGRRQKKNPSRLSVSDTCQFSQKWPPILIICLQKLLRAQLGLRNSLPRALSLAFDLKALAYSLRWYHF